VTELEIKQSIRARDGFRCISCGMANEEHVRRHHRALEVHRLSPDGVYDIDECVTVCTSCRQHFSL
jgi:hypothetical protein